MVKKKPQSKRKTLADKHKIERKVRDHKKKLRKEAKKMGAASHRKGIKKDIGIPNLWPFKEELLQSLERKKAKVEEEKERQKEARRRELEKRRKSDTPMSIASLSRDVLARTMAYEKTHKDEEEQDEEQQYGGSDPSRRAFYRELRKVVEASDVVLEVLDARDPLGCRCPELEATILGQDASKKIVLVLNKIDLVPKENVEAWLKYLRREYATVAFKASTQSQRAHLSRSHAKSTEASADLLQSNKCLGADTLIQLLKNYSRSEKIKTAITVGIIGYPNVGKSSVINSLKRAKAVNVGNMPGVTKSMQEVQLDRKIKLLDCPGIVFSGSTGNDNPNMVLRNVVKLEDVADPESVVNAIVNRCPKQMLMKLYEVPRFEDTHEFLAHVARKRMKVSKGGIPDFSASARSILMDWNRGKIPFFSSPPEVVEDERHTSAAIVSQWGSELDIESILDQEKVTVLDSLDTTGEGFIGMPSSGPGTMGSLDEEMNGGEEEEEEDEVEGIQEDEEEEEEEEEEEDAMEEDTRPATRKTKQVNAPKQKLKDESDAFNPQLNRANKKLEKQRRKNKRRGVQNGSAGGNDMEDDRYNFSTDFAPRGNAFTMGAVEGDMSDE